MGEGGGGEAQLSFPFSFPSFPFPQKRLILRLGKPITQSIQF